MNRFRFYFYQTIAWSTPAIVWHNYENWRDSYTKWDIGLCFLCYEAGFGYKT